MKKIIVSLALLANLTWAEAQLKTPTASPLQTVKQEFGLADIELSYGRPSAKGRVVFGNLVPFNAVWRTGANGATTLNFGDDVIIGGKKIAKGKYGLLSIPEANKWTLIITKQLNVTSPAAYKAEEDVVRIQANTKKLTDKVETFTIDFENVSSSSVDLVIRWENTSVSLPITTDVDGKVMAQIDQQLNKDNRPYYAAAMYYLENGKDAAKAAEWFDKAVEQNPNAFWVHHYRAKAYAKLGNKKVAKEAAEKSLALAKEQNNGDYVKLNEDLLKSL